MASVCRMAAAQCITAAAVAIISLTLQGCGGGEEHQGTTLTTTFACPFGEIPWPQPHKSPPLECQTNEEARMEANEFLTQNMPPWDLLNNETLHEGILGPALNLSLTARDIFPWGEYVPKDIWHNYVLPYANVNEPRVDWRTLLYNNLRPLVQNPHYQANTSSDVVMKLNEELWSTLRSPPITFKSDQTPLIYDPMSTITVGYASCTGISILFVDALRALGVPARIAGTPAWSNNASKGNHNWVEVWLGPGKGLNGEAWVFLEGKPAGAGETLLNPCDKWFCNAAHFDGKTKAYAPQWDKTTNKTWYPMAWGLQNEDIPGVDRTDYYNALCQPCGKTEVNV